MCRILLFLIFLKQYYFLNCDNLNCEFCCKTGENGQPECTEDTLLCQLDQRRTYEIFLLALVFISGYVILIPFLSNFLKFLVLRRIKIFRGSFLEFVLQNIYNFIKYIFGQLKKQGQRKKQDYTVEEIMMNKMLTFNSQKTICVQRKNVQDNQFSQKYQKNQYQLYKKITQILGITFERRKQIIMSISQAKAKQMVKDIWQQYDKDNSGSLDRHECMKLFKDIAQVTNDYRFYRQSDQILKHLDKDGDGNLSQEEFIDLIINYSQLI